LGTSLRLGGGGFNAFLYVEEKGKKYSKAGDGRPLLPVFQTLWSPLDFMGQGSHPPVAEQPFSLQ
jgi:hypothetical protein